MDLNEILEKLSQMHDVRTDLTVEEMTKEKVNLYNSIVGNLNEVDGYNCDICKNKGFIAEYKDGNEVHIYCKCQKTRETLRRAKRSGLGDILSNFTFDKYEATDEWQKQIKAKAQAFCKDEKANWFYIGGQVGAGKTHICTAIAGYYIKKGYETQYMLWCEESKKLKALVNDYTEYQKAITPYKDAPVLYIDDFLKTRQFEQPTQADITLAFEIINHRLMSEDKITIISSEKTLTDLLEYDEATMSRIYQQAGNYKVMIEKAIDRNYRLRG